MATATTIGQIQARCDGLRAAIAELEQAAAVASGRLEMVVDEQEAVKLLAVVQVSKNRAALARAELAAVSAQLAELQAKQREEDRRVAEAERDQAKAAFIGALLSAYAECVELLTAEERAQSFARYPLPADRPFGWAQALGNILVQNGAAVAVAGPGVGRFNLELKEQGV